MNDRIQKSSGPMMYKVLRDEIRAPAKKPTIRYRVDVRSLRGMQKEAVVTREAPGGSSWRLVSDEGPYLEGDDLAPPPLSFFGAGMLCCYMTRLKNLAVHQGVEIGSMSFVQDTWYSMKGSILKGDMTGGAAPVDVLVRLDSDAPRERVLRLTRAAMLDSPAHSMMEVVLADTFSIRLNGRPVPVSGVRASPRSGIADPLPGFESLRRDEGSEYSGEIITKVSAVERVEGVEGGASTSLRPVQDRRLNVRSDGRFLDRGQLKESVATLVSPLGSTFRFLSDEDRAEGGTEQAPPALAFLSAGLGFCYMTQLGRYAKIVKLKVRAFRIVQFTEFTREDADSGDDWKVRPVPVDTHVFIDSEESVETVQKLVSMGEQTCFLHAAMRGSHPSKIRVEFGDSHHNLEIQ